MARPAAPWIARGTSSACSVRGDSVPAELPLTPAHYRVCFELVSGCHLAAQSPVYILRLYLRGSYRCPGAVPHTSRFPLLEEKSRVGGQW